MCSGSGTSLILRSTLLTMNLRSGAGMAPRILSTGYGGCLGSGTCNTEVTFIKLTTNFLGDGESSNTMVYSEELEMPPDRDLLGEYAESKLQM